MQYELIPEVVDAVQWTGDNIDEVAKVAGRFVRRSGFWLVLKADTFADVVHVYQNDWVIKDRHGDIRTLTTLQFQSRYRPKETA
jgi:hypothetical protein